MKFVAFIFYSNLQKHWQLFYCPSINIFNTKWWINQWINSQANQKDLQAAPPCFRERRSTIEKFPDRINQVIDFMIAVYLTENHQKVWIMSLNLSNSAFDGHFYIVWKKKKSNFSSFVRSCKLQQYKPFRSTSLFVLFL